MKVSIPTLIIGLFVVGILLIFAFTYQVNFYEAAVKVRLGKARAIITEPGLKFRWVWPIESIHLYDTRLRTLDSPEAEIKTSDGKNVIVGTYAVWRIADPLQFHKEGGDVAKAEEQMRTRIAQVQAAVIGQRTLSDFVNLDREAVDKSYDSFLADMLGRKEVHEGRELRVGGVYQRLLDDFGIEVVQIGIRRISLPKEVTQEVFKSMIQDRKALAAKYREEGKSRAAAITGRAESEAKQILAFADRKAQEIRSAGVQASTRILSQISAADREFFEWLRWLDALKATLKQKTTIFLDQSSPLFNPFVRPPVPLTDQSESGSGGQ